MYYLNDFANFERKTSDNIRDIAIGGLGGAATLGGAASGALNTIPQTTPTWASRVVKSGWLGSDLAEKVAEDEKDILKDMVRNRELSRKQARSLMKKLKSPKVVLPRPTYNNDPVIAGAIRAASVLGLVGGAGLTAAALSRREPNNN